MSDGTDPTLEDYGAAHPRSAALFQRQSERVPGGLTHRSRHRLPFPLFVSHAEGPYKHTVDGRRLIDYWMGHGALLLGNADPATVEAVRDQAAWCFHGNGETELGLRWAELVCRLVPAAERVRFTSSGGEAVQLAVRVARAATGRTRVIAFRHGFHGWGDQFAFTSGRVAGVSGVPSSLRGSVEVLEYNDLDAVTRMLEQDREVAAVILEPAGAFNDSVPVDPTFLQGLRTVTEQQDVVLIFDEVVTGFRYAPGGAQEHFGVAPDLVTLGKILSGGLPAGAVAGRPELLDVTVKQADPAAPHVEHSGTWNANPLVAAAGIATLQQVDSKLTSLVTERADALREGFNEQLRRAEIDGIAYGRSSIVKLHFGARPPITRGEFGQAREDADLVMAGTPGFDQAFERAMVLEGVDWKGTTGFVSAAHAPEHVDETIAAFGRALERAIAAVGRPDAG